jgi:hypothetical protein
MSPEDVKRALQNADIDFTDVIEVYDHDFCGQLLNARGWNYLHYDQLGKISKHKNFKGIRVVKGEMILQFIKTIS